MSLPEALISWLVDSNHRSHKKESKTYKIYVLQSNHKDNDDVDWLIDGLLIDWWLMMMQNYFRNVSTFASEPFFPSLSHEKLHSFTSLTNNKSARGETKLTMRALTCTSWKLLPWRRGVGVTAPCVDWLTDARLGDGDCGVAEAPFPILQVVLKCHTHTHTNTK